MKKEKKKESRGLKPFIKWAVICIFMILIYLIFAPEKERQFSPITMADLAGVWTTTATGYEDRFLQFEDETITFGWGEAGVGTYKIAEIHSEPEEFVTRVQVRYTDTNLTAYEFGFKYLKRDKGLIRMQRTRDENWERIRTKPIHTPDFR